MVRPEGKMSFPEIPKTFPLFRIVCPEGKLGEISGKLIRHEGKIVSLCTPAAGPEGKLIFFLGKGSGES